MTTVGLLKSVLAVSLPAVLRQCDHECEGKQPLRKVRNLLSWSLSGAAVEPSEEPRITFEREQRLSEEALRERRS